MSDAAPTQSVPWVGNNYWRALIAAVVAPVLLTCAKLLFRDVLGEATPFLLYFAAILVAAWAGGFWAGALATVLAGALGAYFFLPLEFDSGPHLLRALTRLLAFVAEGLAITLLVGGLRAAQQRSASAAREAMVSLAKLEAVLEGVDDGITVQDVHGKLIFANSPAARLSGYADTEAFLQAPVSEVMGRFELLSPDGSPFPLNNLPGRRVLQGLPYEDQVVRFRVKATGEERWSLLRASPVRLPGGEVPYAVNVFHDITELRKRDALLQASQAWFATALHSIGDAVIATDAVGQVTFMNPLAVELTGYSTAEAQGKPLTQVFAIFNETTREPVESPVERVLREGRVVGLANHTILVSKAGMEVAIDDSAAPIRGEGDSLIGTVLVFRDVSSKRIEERQRSFLEQSTAELNSSLDYKKTLSTIARLAVPAIADWCAVDVVEKGALKRLVVEHIDAAKIELVFEIERRYPADPMRRTGAYGVLHSGEPQVAFDIPEEALEGAAKDAEHLRLIRQLELRSYIAVPLLAQGRTVGVISLALSGKTSRRYTKLDLGVATALADRAGLAMTNAALFAEAHEARVEAEQANRSKDEFLAMLGHELRNPLAPILTALQLMKLRQPELFEKERAVIDRQVRHMVTLVDDLLDVSRIAYGRIELTKENLELADVVHRALELAQPLLEERKHELVMTVPRGLRVCGDAVRLSQVVANLLTNAAKYTNRGGRISVDAKRAENEIQLSVRDNGVGIEPDLLPHVFNLFVQGRQALDRSRGGLGLGLAIVQSVVQMHGGRVSAHSDGGGQGSEFRIYLPSVADEVGAEPHIAPTAAPVPQRQRSAAHSARVLIVDDNFDARMFLLEGLQLLGHQTYSAEDAASALTLAAAFKPEIALLDIGLPLMNGYELARQLRQLPGLEAIKLVAVTGYGQPADKDQAAEAGFDQHLVKPISLEQVQSALELVRTNAV